MSSWVKVTPGLSLAIASLLMGCTQSDPESTGVETRVSAETNLSQPDQMNEIVFGVYTTDTAKEAVQKFRPLLDEIEKDYEQKYGRKLVVQTNIYANYDDGIEAIVNGDVDFMRLGPASFVLSEMRNPDIRLIAMETYKNSKTFHGIICIHEDSDISGIEDLAGRTFAFGDKNSTIGRYLSQQLLMEHGVYGADLFSYHYLGKHDKVGYMVSEGEFDAGALKESTFKKLKDKGEPIKELARFPNVTKPWVARSGLDESVYLMIRESILNQKDPEVLASVGKTGFADAEAGDYALIRESIQVNPEFASQEEELVLEELETSS